MIETILPAAAHAVEEFGDTRAGPLFPDEEAVVANAVPQRRNEFSAVRRCARRALAERGHPPVALLPGPGGAPAWPEGIVGSMTHCAGYRAAVVADRAHLSSIGIDAEPDEPLPRDVLRIVARPDEIERFRAGIPVPSRNWDRLLFSAKEAVYKAWYPLTGRWLDFTDVSVSPTSDPRGFTADVLVPAPGRARLFRGTWTTGDGLILTASVPVEPHRR
ncbi:4'-phosphopantetheinyl transferase family protein [Microbacterium testaceum]|uniref:4'-phosphopantetheinyl transferase family protein n=1 Tax=Microbacterium testaceum TaxID=2033 RepID=UPI0025B12A3A|nr:4'-phosphopantetheinyl transferase superfamily protein [Microbacterium testaceum]WJS90750.1 4'-phosphopantetheinyl transferase superfamily protein [Microbacterium testaceum]